MLRKPQRWATKYLKRRFAQHNISIGRITKYFLLGIRSLVGPLKIPLVSLADRHHGERARLFEIGQQVVGPHRPFAHDGPSWESLVAIVIHLQRKAELL